VVLLRERGQGQRIESVKVICELGEARTIQHFKIVNHVDDFSKHMLHCFAK
jgi:hypothetical protein